MEPEAITAYTGLVGAVVALLGLIGGGISFVIRRADRRRETGETELVAQLRKDIRHLKREVAMREADGTAWRDQLMQNKIRPYPPHWTPIPEETE